MQATESKPQSNGKCHNTGGNKTSSSSKAKKADIAPRVMRIVTEQSTDQESASTTPTASPNVTASNGSSCTNNGTNNADNGSNSSGGSKIMNEGTSILKVSGGSDSNSVGSTNDHEVETITNRAAKLDLSPASTTNGKQITAQTATKSQTSSTSSLLPPLSDSTTTATTVAATTLGPSQQHHQQQNYHLTYHKPQQQQQQDTSCSATRVSSSSNIKISNNNGGSNNNVSFNLLLQQASSKSDLVSGEYMNEQQHPNRVVGDECCGGVGKKAPTTTDTMISLETKVPHPLRSNFQNLVNEEVSYYNDTPAVLEPKLVGGSLDNNTRPRLLAASIREQHSQQQLLIDAALPKTASSCQQLRHNISTPTTTITANTNNNTNINWKHSKRNLYINEQPAQSGAINNNNNIPFDISYPHQHIYNEYDVADEYYMRHDNTLTERDLAGAQRQSHKPLANEHSSMTVTETFATVDSDQRCQKPSVCVSTSPKAKSAPATPCNVTPTAFHQHTSHQDSTTGTGANLANTLPPDIRKNLSATCRVLPGSIVTFGARDPTISGDQSSNTTSNTMLHGPINLKNLDHLKERAAQALRDKDYAKAIRLFSQCINLATSNGNVDYLKKNFKIYSHRAEAHFNLGNYHEAIDDSMAARELNPKWTKAYYLQGRSQFMIGQHADSLAVFSFGLTQDPTNRTLFEALIEAALNNTANNFNQEFEAKFSKLKALKMDNKPYVVVAILGQELLAKGHSQHAAIVLESALKINNSLESLAASTAATATQSSSSSSLAAPMVGTAPATATPGANGNLNGNIQTIEGTPNYLMKFKSSVLSSISLAYCMMRDYDKAIANMEKEYEIEKKLEDVNGQCRVQGNLGYTYFKMRKLDKSREAHRKQLHLAMKTHLFPEASQALNALGHVHEARGDYQDALNSHGRCFDILKQLGDNYFSQFKELLSMGYIYSMQNELNLAQEKYKDAYELLIKNRTPIGQEDFTIGTIMVNFNMAYLELKRQRFQEARECYDSVIKLAQKVTDETKKSLIEVRASNGMGQTYRLHKRFEEASSWFKQQLQLANEVNYELGKSQALCNLGMIYQHYKDYQKAWQLFDDNLMLVDKNPLLKAYAHSYMGSTYYLMKKYNDAKMHYELALDLFRGLDYCPSELKAIESNLASVQERMSSHEAVILSSSGNNLHSNSNHTTHHKKVMMQT